MTAQPIIETEDLTRRYGRTVGLDGLTIAVERGEVFGFLGPNGSGKTTTIRLLLDLIRPTRGAARLFGRPAHDASVRSRVGYLPGELTLDERLTGRRTFEFLDALRAGTPDTATRRRREEICERLGLSDDDLGRRVREYSRGMKQKIGLAAALQHDPDLLILDEPTTGLDPLVREQVFEVLRDAGARGKTVFHSSHVLSEVDRTCTRVGMLRRGRLIEVMRIDDIRRTSQRRMVIRFTAEPPLNELKIPGVELVEHDGNQVVLRVSGELNSLLHVLAHHSVEHLVFPEPDLEEAFVGFYES